MFVGVLERSPGAFAFVSRFTGGDAGFDGHFLDSSVFSVATFVFLGVGSFANRRGVGAVGWGFGFQDTVERGRFGGAFFSHSRRASLGHRSLLALRHHADFSVVRAGIFAVWRWVFPRRARPRHSGFAKAFAGLRVFAVDDVALHGAVLRDGHEHETQNFGASVAQSRNVAQPHFARIAGAQPVALGFWIDLSRCPRFRAGDVCRDDASHPNRF